MKQRRREAAEQLLKETLNYIVIFQWKSVKRDVYW